MDNNLQGLYRMNLQLLAEGGEEQENNDAENKNDNAGSKTYTEEELKARLQAESDKRVTEALKTAKSKWEKEYSERLEKEKSEAKKLAEMDAQQKAEYERDQLKAELDKLKDAHSKSEMLKTARKMLGEHDINLEDDLLTLLVTNEAETTKKNIENFTGLFSKAVEKAVNDKLKGNTPKKGKVAKLTKDEILKIENAKERRKAILENLDLFE